MGRAHHASESERCGLCPHCGDRCRIKKTRSGHELHVDCRDRRCAQNGRQTATTETTRICPQNIGSYLPPASWADKFRAAGFRVTES